MKTVATVCLLLICTTFAFAQSEGYGTIKTLETAVESGNATRDQKIELARLYLEAGRYYEARKLAENVLALNAGDDDATAIRNRAAEELRNVAQRNLADAEARVNSADATDADRHALADAYFEAARYTEAADAYARLPQSMQTRETRLRRARALAWSRQMDEAEREYAALLRDSGTPELDLEYGRLLSWMGASRVATNHLRSAYDGLGSEDSAVALANARAWAGDREGAIRLLNDYMVAHPDATEASRLLASMRTSPALRLERLDKLIALEPYNLALRVNRARLLYEMEDYGEAMRTVRFVREHSAEPVADIAELERLILQHRDEERARLAQRLATTDTNNAGNADDILSLAKGYSSIEEYDRSIDLYEDYLRARPDDTEARINYARVLSWDQRYDAAQNQYERLIQQYPERADLRLEYAQTLSWDSEYVPALRAFRSLTDTSSNPRAYLYETVPPRAHFNIGQIYRWFGWNDHAEREQNAALLLDASYEPSLTEINRIRLMRPATNIEGRYSYATDSNDFDFRRYDLMGEKWVSSRTAFNALLGRHEFERTSTNQQIEATALSGGVRHRFSDRFLGRARVGANLYSDDLGTRPFWGIGAEWLPSIQSRAALDYNRYDLVYDVFTLQALGDTPGAAFAFDPIHIDDLRAHYDYRTGGFWSWLADASYGRISDDNTRVGAHGLLSFRVFKTPFVAIKADGRYLSYDRRTRNYWSPEDYRSLAGILQIGQNLRRFEWSAEVKAGKSWERDRSSDIRSYGLSAAVGITPSVDLVADYGYGKSGRFDDLVGGSDNDLTNYWRRHWFVGLRVKQLFTRGDRQGGEPSPYYYDNRVLSTSPVIPPVGETR
ncbi:MAG TPA: hypothetical protein VF618_27250 [Thermoanaerobaculia bacterium]